MCSMRGSASRPSSATMNGTGRQGLGIGFPWGYPRLLPWHHAENAKTSLREANASTRPRPAPGRSRCLPVAFSLGSVQALRAAQPLRPSGHNHRQVARPQLGSPRYSCLQQRCASRWREAATSVTVPATRVDGWCSSLPCRREHNRSLSHRSLGAGGPLPVMPDSGPISPGCPLRFKVRGDLR